MDSPSDESNQYPRIVRLFPLAEHVFLPDLPTPFYALNDSECALVEDLLELPEEERWLGLPRRLAHPLVASPGTTTLGSIATIGRMVHALPLEHHRYHIVIRGVFRARLVEVPSGRPYPIALVEPWPDVAPAVGEASSRSEATMLQMLTSLAHQLGDAFDGISGAVRSSPDLSTTIYRLGAIFVDDLEWRQRLLETQRLEERLAIVEDALAGVLALGFGASLGNDA